MQVSSINPSFSGRREVVDAIVGMDDNSIQRIAEMQTEANFNTKRSRRLTNALFYSAPIAAGVATAVLGGGKATTLFSKNVTGLTARLARGGKVAALWTAALGAIDLLGFGHKKLAQNSSAVRSFDKNHPLLSIGGMLAAAFGAVALVNKGAVKLSSLKAPEFLKNFAEKADKFLQTNKAVLSTKNKTFELLNKTPEALKSIGATALDWAPTALLLGGLFHSINSSSRKNREFMNNYSSLKEQQQVLTQARLRELSMQNDFLMQDPKNREDMELLQSPLKGII